MQAGKVQSFIHQPMSKACYRHIHRMHGLSTYDYGARQHDPILGRWDRIDPLCEKYYDVSPYVYCKDNPTNSIDPDGRSVWKIGIKAVVKAGRTAIKKGVKSLDKASTYADAFDDIIKDGTTLFNPNASTSSRVKAGISLLSEALPISINDVKDAKKYTKQQRITIEKFYKK